MPAIGAAVVQWPPCGWRRGFRSLRLRAQLCFDRGKVFQYWRTKLEQACVDCFAPQISGWNDSDGEPARPGTGLEGWQTRTRRGTLTPSILVRIQVPEPHNLVILPRFVGFRLQLQCFAQEIEQSRDIAPRAGGARSRRAACGVASVTHPSPLRASSGGSMAYWMPSSLI